MSNVIRNLVVKVGADTRVFEDNMKKVSKELKTHGQAMQAFGSQMTQFVTLPLAAGGAAAIKMAADYGETLNKLDAIFEGNAQEVKDWSKTTLDQLGLARSTSADMVAAFGDMATSMGFTKDEAAKLGVQLVGRAADMASFKNVSIDVANTGMTAVFTGETESLKKLGVVMTEANLKQFMLAEGYTKTYTELSQYEKVMLRADYVMQATNNAAGDFARTSDSASNQMKLVVESAKELGVAFGEELLPMVLPLIKGTTDLLKEFGSLDTGTKKMIVSAALLAAGIGPVVSIMGKVTTASSKVTGWLAKQAAAHAATAVSATTSTTAIAGTTTATNGLAAASGVATAAMGPLIAVAAVLAIAAIAVTAKTNELNAAMEDLDTQRAESAGKMAASEAVVANAIAQVTSAMKDNTVAQEINYAASQTSIETIKAYGDALMESDSRMSEWDGGISDAQARLSELADQVAEESRSYTEAEIKEISALIDVIDEYTQKKAELYQSRMGTLSVIIQQERQLTAEQMTAYIDEVDGFYGEIETLSNESYAKEIASLQELYGEEGELDKESFNRGLYTAKLKRDKAIEAAEQERDDVIAVLQDKKVKATEVELAYFTDVVTAQDNANNLRLEKDTEWIRRMLILQENFNNGKYSQAEYLELIRFHENEINDEYNQKIIDADAAYADALLQGDTEMVAAKIETYRELAAAGITISEEELTAVNSYLDAIGEARINIVAEVAEINQGVSDSLSGLDVDAYTWGSDFVQGLINGINAKGPDAGIAAREIAKGIESQYKNQMQQKSPSKLMAKVGRDTFSPLATEADKVKGMMADKMHGLSKVMKLEPIGAVTLPNMAPAVSGGVMSTINGTGGFDMSTLIYAFSQALDKQKAPILNMDGRHVSTATTNKSGGMNRQYGKVTTV